MSCQTEQAENIMLKGQFTIGNAHKIYSQIKTSFKGSESLVIILSEIQEIDLSFIQILFSLFRGARKLKKEVFVFIDDPERIQSFLINGGLKHHFQINGNQQENGFRIEGIFNE